MALAISTNFAINANTALNAMNKSQSLMGKSISRISTGNRAANPADDPLSYFSGNKIKGDTDGYQALYNGIQDGAARINVADTALSSIIDVLTEMKSKAIAYESLNSTDKSGDAGKAIKSAYDQLYNSLSSFTSATYKGSSVWSSNDLSFTTTLSGSGGNTDTGTTVELSSVRITDATDLQKDADKTISAGTVKMTKAAGELSTVTPGESVGTLTISKDSTDSNVSNLELEEDLALTLKGTSTQGSLEIYYGDTKVGTATATANSANTSNIDLAVTFDSTEITIGGSSNSGSTEEINATVKLTSAVSTNYKYVTDPSFTGATNVVYDLATGKITSFKVSGNDDDKFVVENGKIYKDGNTGDGKEYGTVTYDTTTAGTNKNTFHLAKGANQSGSELDTLLASNVDVSVVGTADGYTFKTIDSSESSNDAKLTAVSLKAASSSASTPNDPLEGTFTYDGSDYLIDSGKIYASTDTSKSTELGEASFENSTLTIKIEASGDDDTSTTGSTFKVPNMSSPKVDAAKTISSSGVQGVIDTIAKQRTSLGGSLAAMDSISSYLSSMVTANDAAYTAVTEANIAKEMTSYVKNNVYSQAAQAMISQANQSLAQVLNLLQ